MDIARRDTCKDTAHKDTGDIGDTEDIEDTGYSDTEGTGCSDIVDTGYSDTEDTGYSDIVDTECWDSVYLDIVNNS